MINRITYNYYLTSFVCSINFNQTACTWWIYTIAYAICEEQNDSLAKLFMMKFKIHVLLNL